ncbi:MAG: hypothetical protein OWV35_07900 [Firmicutes bacterium]|nr:hypothetical protein [Bacillota bacterium]
MDELVLGFALGAVPADLAHDLTVTLPELYLPGWRARDAATTTDGLAALADPTQPCPWTTLLVTPWLPGTTALPQALVAVKTAWPRLRVAVLFGGLSPAYRTMVTTLAAYQMYNCLIAEQFDFADVVNLVTTDWTWADVAPYLAPPSATPIPPGPALPPRVAAAAPAPRAPGLAWAVVSAQGRSGKTGWIANLLWATAAGESLALDLDYPKPALALYFRPPTDPYPVHLQQLLAAISPAPALAFEDAPGLTPRDRQEVRHYLAQAVTVTPGARLVPGPLRHHALAPVLPPGLATALIQEAKVHAPLVLVDGPAAADPVWAEIVRAVDGVVVLTTPEPLAVLETVALFEQLDRLKVPRRAVRLAVNRVGRGGIPPAEIAAVHLKHPLWAALPDQPRRWAAAFQARQPLAARDRWWARLGATLRPGAGVPHAAPGSRRGRGTAVQPVPAPAEDD